MLTILSVVIDKNKEIWEKQERMGAVFQNCSLKEYFDSN